MDGASRVRAYALGRSGEQAVVQLLTQRGWSIEGRNVRDGPRELDVVARSGSLVAFVEVKSRSRPDGLALESITRVKRRNLARAARHWARLNGRPGDIYRFDVAVVVAVPGAPVQIELLEDAWRPGG